MSDSVEPSPLSNLVDRLDRLFGFRRPHGRFLVRRLPEGINYFYCFGGVAFTLFLILLLSGLFLTVHYVPSGEQAFRSIREITETVPGGRLLRSMHKWSAHLMMVTLLVHMLRVFVSGAYRHPRELTWVAGVTLFMVVLAFGFTGYLLPWNQKAYWATVVGTAIPGTIPVLGDDLVSLLRGGADVTGITLLRFYSLHTHWLPLAAIALLWSHFHMIKRRGISGGL